MERLLQYLDDLDDFYGMVGLIGERLRVLLATTAACMLIAAVAFAAMRLAIVHPPIALATSTLLFVILLYRSVTVPSRSWIQSAG